MDSLYSEQKTERIIRSVATADAASSAAVPNPVLRLKLDRNNFTAEHRLVITAVQSHTNAPTSVDVRRFFTQTGFKLQTDNGDQYVMSGFQLFDVPLLTTQQQIIQDQALVGAGNSTVTFSVDIHHMLHECRQDFITALETGLEGTLDIVLTMIDGTADSGFQGGTVPGFITYHAEVEAIEYPELTGQGIPKFEHYMRQKIASGTTTGLQSPGFELDAKNMTRFICLHAIDKTVVAGAALGAPSDALITNIYLKYGDKTKRSTTWKKVRIDNAAERMVSKTGFITLDFGDDLNGFADLRDVTKVQLDFEIASGAPTWEVQLLQDLVK